MLSLEIEPSELVLALSGGVDSSLAAALLKKAGWDVKGIHLLLPPCNTSQDNTIVEGKKELIHSIADHIGIDVHFLNPGKTFNDQVISPFIQAYLQGLTPNPCVMCNPCFKFKQLFVYGKENGIDYIATGHYARIQRDENGSAMLLRGKDRKKDQSYFLSRLNQEQLKNTLFPLGNMTKDETRKLANDMELPSSTEPESQEICFLAGKDYRNFLEEEKGEALPGKGDIFDKEGNKVGEHSGFYRYTIGQRQGLGIASPRPYYVMKLIPGKNIVVVGRKEDIYTKRVEAEGFQWIGENPGPGKYDASAQVRYRHSAAGGRLENLSGGKVVFEFDEPQLAITPGQALVCYDEDRVLGSGWIREGAKDERLRA